MALRNNRLNAQSYAAGVFAGSAEAWAVRRTHLLINLYAGEGGIDDLSGIPNGYNMSGQLLPLKTGGMRLFGASESNGTATMAAGRGIEASGSATSVGVVNAGAIVPIVADATATSSGTVIMAGAAAMVLSGSATSSGTVEMGGIINILAVSGAAVSSGNCNLTAIGWVEASAGGPAELSAEGLASAVWSALASEFNENGTMGELLNSAGGAASPTITADVVWSRAASSVTTTGSMGEQVKKAKTAAENAFAVSS